MRIPRLSASGRIGPRPCRWNGPPRPTCRSGALPQRPNLRPAPATRHPARDDHCRAGLRRDAFAPGGWAGGRTGLVAGVRGRGSELAAGNRIADMAAAGLNHLDVYCFSVADEIHDALAGGGDGRQAARAPGPRRNARSVRWPNSRWCGRSCPPSAGRWRPWPGTAYRTWPLLPWPRQSGEGSAGARLARRTTAGRPPGRGIGRAAGAAADVASGRAVDPRGRWANRFAAARAVGATRRSASNRTEPSFPRGPYASAGNLLEDDWETIERSEVFQRYRTRVESDTCCNECPGLAICAARLSPRARRLGGR